MPIHLIKGSHTVGILRRDIKNIVANYEQSKITIDCSVRFVRDFFVEPSELEKTKLTLDLYFQGMDYKLIKITLNNKSVMTNIITE